MNRADEMVNPFIENMATVPMAEGDYLSEDGIIREQPRQRKHKRKSCLSTSPWRRK